MRSKEKRKELKKKEEDEIKFIVLFESRSNIQIFKYSSFHYTSIFFYLRSKHICVSPPPSSSSLPLLNQFYNYSTILIHSSFFWQSLAFVHWPRQICKLVSLHFHPENQNIQKNCIHVLNWVSILVLMLPEPSFSKLE